MNFIGELSKSNVKRTIDSNIGVQKNRLTALLPSLTRKLNLFSENRGFSLKFLPDKNINGLISLLGLWKLWNSFDENLPLAYRILPPKKPWSLINSRLRNQQPNLVIASNPEGKVGFGTTSFCSWNPPRILVVSAPLISKNSCLHSFNAAVISKLYCLKNWNFTNCSTLNVLRFSH